MSTRTRGFVKSYPAVQEAVRAYALAGFERNTNYYVVVDVATALGHDAGEWPGDTFAGQVKRALNALAQDGTIIKVPRGERLPWGGPADEPHYYLPEQYAREVEQGVSATAKREAAAQRREALVARAEELGLDVSLTGFGSDKTIAVGVDSLETLLNAYERNPA